MPTPGEHKTVQARILAYAEAIGWTFVSREEAEERGGAFLPPCAGGTGTGMSPLRCAHSTRAMPRLLRTSRHLHTDIYGNPPSPKGYGGTGRESVEHLRNRGKFCDHQEKCDHFQDLFRTLHYELMAANTRVHALNFQSKYHE